MNTKLTGEKSVAESALEPLKYQLKLAEDRESRTLEQLESLKKQLQDTVDSRKVELEIMEQTLKKNSQVGYGLLMKNTVIYYRNLTCWKSNVFLWSVV